MIKHKFFAIFIAFMMVLTFSCTKDEVSNNQTFNTNQSNLRPKCCEHSHPGPPDPNTGEIPLISCCNCKCIKHTITIDGGVDTVYLGGAHVVYFDYVYALKVYEFTTGSVGHWDDTQVHDGTYTVTISADNHISQYDTVIYVDGYPDHDMQYILQ